MQRRNYNVSSHNPLTMINENTVKYYWSFVAIYYTFLKNVNAILITSKDLYVDITCKNVVI